MNNLVSDCILYKSNGERREGCKRSLFLSSESFGMLCLKKYFSPFSNPENDIATIAIKDFRFPTSKKGEVDIYDAC